MGVTPVNIVGAEKPIPVTVEETKHEDKLVTKESKQTLAPNTTEEEDAVTAGQRRINLIWENTQAIIALMVCLFTMVAGILVVLAVVFWGKPDMQIPTIFSVAFGTVIGFYFSRTNHQKTGGVQQNQVGR